MAVSIESYLLINFLMNALSIAIVARSLGRFCLRRILFAAGAGAVFAVLSKLPPLTFLGGAALSPFIAAGLSAIAFPSDSIRALPGNAARLLGAIAFLGGVQFLLRNFVANPILAALAGAALGGCALAAFFTARQKRLVTWEVSVCLCFNGAQARFRALVDTGNRLREPFSALPVLIAEMHILRDVLPEGFHAEAKAPPEGFRQVAFGALGGGGRLFCFRPDLTLISYGNGYIKAPDLWVAVYPGHLPGTLNALAPPIVGCVEQAQKILPEKPVRKKHQTRGEGIWH